MADDDNGDCWGGCCALAILIIIIGVTISVVVSITLLILILGAWIPYVCYGKPVSWKDYFCQFCLISFCWCSKNKPPLWFREYCCCFVCYQIDDDDTGCCQKGIIMTHPRHLFEGAPEVPVITQQPQSNTVFMISKTTFAMQSETLPGQPQHSNPGPSIQEV